jgi:hypothetical protein
MTISDFAIALVRFGRSKRLGSVAGFAAGLLLCVSGAYSLADGAEAAGTNTRALRLTGVDGQVQVIQDGQVIADPAPNNLPIFEGTQIVTRNDGRAEVQLEDGSVARLSPNSTLTFTVLQRQGTNTRTEMVLNRGLGYFELEPSTADHELRVSYGSSSFTADSFAVIRVNEDVAPGELAVLSGSIELVRGSALELALHGGETLTLDPADESKYNLSEGVEPDSWDNWNADRDQLLTTEAAEKTAAGGQFGNGQSAGMGDLDAYGNWYNVPGQGYVWSPFEAESGGDSWDPYGYGNWVDYPGSGYLWVSGYDWGFAPYQCGLWNYYDDFGWGWAPGIGCNPWYGMGGGWFFNIGTFPRGYRPPRRPLPSPVKPRPIGGPLRASSIIPVDRRSTGRPVDGGVDGGRISHPVTIAGHIVEPLKPLAPRPAYDRNGSMAYSRAMGAHTGSGYGTEGGPYTGVRSGAASHLAYPPPSPGVNHAQSHAYMPSSHPSGGGAGGGGGGHASAPAPSGGHSGGGGGGGGGTHK